MRLLPSHSDRMGAVGACVGNLALPDEGCERLHVVVAAGVRSEILARVCRVQMCEDGPGAH